MMATRVKIQLLIFGLVTVLAGLYAALNLFDLGTVVQPSYSVKAEFAHAGNIYARAEVTLLGTPVGHVTKVQAGPGTQTTVVLVIDHGTRIPADVVATMANKSAIGEPYVDLEPRSSRGPLLAGGDVLAARDTVSSVDVSDVIGNLSSLAGSIPRDDLATTLDELTTAVNGVGPQLGQLLTASHTVAGASVASVADLTSLIQSASTVLSTQVALSPRTATYLQQLASLTSALREVDPKFDETFANGIRATSAVTNLLQDNQAALPALLTDLLTVTNVAADRIPQLRKTLVVFPWMYEDVASALRYCDSYDVHTGVPRAGTCHYDAQGHPIWSVHLAAQLPEPPGTPPYYPCTNGYGATKKYLPDGRPVNGTGATEGPDAEPNLGARCANSPTDPNQPNVRGSQNVPAPSAAADRAPTGFAIYDPSSGVVTATDGSSYQLQRPLARPRRHAGSGLAQLLTAAMSGDQ